MKVIILGGFSGSGKTTVLLRLAEYVQELDRKGTYAALAVVENEIGTADIDAKRLTDRGVPVESLLAGCCCCGLSEELAACIKRMGQREHPDWLVVEAAGLGIPWKIRENLKEQTGLDAVIWVVADAGRWLLLNDPLSRLAAGQLYGAGAVLINTSAEVSQDLQKRVELSVASNAEGAAIYTVNAAKGIKSSIWKRLLKRM